MRAFCTQKWLEIRERWASRCYKRREEARAAWCFPGLLPSVRQPAQGSRGRGAACSRDGLRGCEHDSGKVHDLPAPGSRVQRP